MDLYTFTRGTVAIVLVALALDMLPTMIRRFLHVGWRYRTAVITGYLFVICTILTYFTDSQDWLGQVVGVLQAIAGIVLAVAAGGYIDFVFNNRHRRTKSSR